MIQEELNKMINKVKMFDKVVIVGAGKTLINIMALLRVEGITVNEVFDNNDKLTGNVLDGVVVQKPHRINGAIYIIDVKDDFKAKELSDQLVSLGIDLNDIVRQPHFYVPDEIDLSDISSVKKVLDELYCERFNRYINWRNPQTYNEIINYEKIYDRSDKKRELADKYLVRGYVERAIGSKYLTKLYGVWDDSSNIVFEKLPDKYVLKTNNGSSRNIIVNEHNKLDHDQMRKLLKRWMVSDYWKPLLEYQYKDINPVIMCEEYLDGIGESIGEYKLYCFHGKVKYIGYERNSHLPGWRARIYDRDWNPQEFSYGIPLDNEVISRPNSLDEMIEVSELLSKDFRHVRVDLYDLPDGRILFGEMTFSSWGGMKHFNPESWDYEFGKLITNWSDTTFE